MLLAYGGSHQKIISSIAGILESAHINFIIVAPPGSQTFLRSRHKNVVTFSEICCFPEIPEEYRTLFSEMIEDSLQNNDLYKDSYYYLGNSLIDTIKLIQSGKYAELFPGNKLSAVESDNYSEMIRKLFIEHKRQFLLPVSTMEKIIKKIDPDLIITTNSPRAERASQIGAYNLRIPCITVIDGFGTTEQYRITDVDHILVPNSFASKKLEQKGVNSDIITVAGNPVLENILNIDKKNALLYLKERKVVVDKYQKIILYPKSLSYYDHKAWNVLDRFVDKMAELHSDYLFIVKNHPGDHCGKEFNNENIVQLEESVDILSFIQLSNLLLASHSLAAIEGAVIGKTSLIYQTRNNSPLKGLEIGTFVFADTEAQLYNLFEQSVMKFQAPVEIIKKDFRSSFLKIVQEYM